jgi:hypothetical protein
MGISQHRFPYIHTWQHTYFFSSSLVKIFGILNENIYASYGEICEEAMCSRKGKM